MNNKRIARVVAKETEIKYSQNLTLPTALTSAGIVLDSGKIRVRDGRIDIIYLMHGTASSGTASGGMNIALPDNILSLIPYNSAGFYDCKVGFTNEYDNGGTALLYHSSSGLNIYFLGITASKSVKFSFEFIFD